VGALIALLAACTPPDAPAETPWIGRVAIGTDASFTAAFWTEVAPADERFALDGGCVRTSGAPAELAPRSAGALTLSAPSGAWTSAPEALYETVFYPPPDLAGLPPDEPIEVRGAGDEIQAFTGTIDRPPPVGEVTFGPTAVTWTPTGAGHVLLTVEPGALPGTRWECPTDDDGDWALPAFSGPDLLRVEWRVEVVREAETEDGPIALVGWTGAAGSVAVP
jgi:hypothetical protein